MATTRLDLQLIPTFNLTTVAFADTSVYQFAPTNMSMEITVPGYSKSNVTFMPYAVNIYNMSTLGIGCDDPTLSLPDGIYTLTYSVAPNTENYVTKSFMRTSTIRSEFERKFLALDIECNCTGGSKSVLKTKLRDIDLLINGSVAAANQCNSSLAYLLYAKAYNLLSVIQPCDCQ